MIRVTKRDRIKLSFIRPYYFAEQIRMAYLDLGNALDKAIIVYRRLSEVLTDLDLWQKRSYWIRFL